MSIIAATYVNSKQNVTIFTTAFVYNGRIPPLVTLKNEKNVTGQKCRPATGDATTSKDQGYSQPV